MRKFWSLKSQVATAVFLFLSFPIVSSAKVVRYELQIKNEKVNMSGKKEVDFALTVNGGIPAPTLEFTEGDDAEILVKNELPGKEEVSIHWHGILLPPEEDGVPYANTPPIFPGTSRLFKFKIRQHGTYWYHSHTMLQEQKGVYGAIVIHPKNKTIRYDKDVVVVLSDWSDENADQIVRNLRKDGDFYLYKKDSVRSIGGAVRAGKLKNYFANEWQRMGGMDLSDVGYDAFLMNGKRSLQLADLHPGQTARVRIINAAASSYFYVSMGGAPLKVVSADGMDIWPLNAREILIGMAETYDILFTPEEHKNFELRATAQDITGFASGWIGIASAEKVSAPTKEPPDLYASMDHSSMSGMDHSSMPGTDHSKMPQMDHSSMPGMDHSKMDHSSMAKIDSAKMDHSVHARNSKNAPISEENLRAINTLTVDELKAPSSTVLPKDKKALDVKLVLGGDMERYVWHINGKAIHEDRTIEINEGDIVRFTFVNETMMHHPMHLHGHFFRVLNQFGDRSPLKHTVDVPPHGTRTIEFYANEPGQWMLHCHNLYHMETGMARLVKYSTFSPQGEMAVFDKQDPHLHEHIYNSSSLELSGVHAEASLKLMRTWDELLLDLESRSHDTKQFSFEEPWENEGSLVYRRWYGNFLNFNIGGESFNRKGYGLLGVGYILPLLIDSEIYVSNEGKVRLNLEKRFQWTKNLFSEVELSWRPNWSADKNAEFEASFMYGPSWYWSAGLMATDKNIGVGAKVRF